ncbi:cutinase family protein [Corynebacterium phoceense]|uniref:cutinase family protein n=1 Tax=Corynebacterium phoceense TaxID=1686286 RepID=UPI00211C5589|nr:cutinase family protein [Corynebacterium phoceense]
MTLSALRSVLACLLVAVIAVLLVHAAPRAVARQCTAIHVLQAAGTGFSARYYTAEPVGLDFSGWNPVDTLQIRLGADDVSGTNIQYPASLGRFSAFQPNALGSEAATYGESVRAGVEDARRELEYVERACPSTRYMVIGYSQGASVAGDIAAEISAGRVKGVTPDDVAAVILVADPGRARLGAPPARPAKLYGPVPAGTRAANGEIILDGGTGVSAGREGMTGQRPGNFAGMEGKVVSLCNNTDMACATPSDTIVRDIADYANRVE